MATKNRLLIVDANIPHAVVRRVANQAVNNITHTQIQWDTVVSEEGISYDAVNFGYDIVQEGFYSVSAFAQYANIPVAAGLGIEIRVNGVVNKSIIVQNVATIAGLFSCVGIAHGLFLSSGDFVDVMVYQSSGAARNLSPDGASSRVSEFAIVGLLGNF